GRGDCQAGRALPVARLARVGARAVAGGAPLADPGPAPTATGRGPPRKPSRPGAPRDAARAARSRPARQDLDRRGARARSRDRDARTQAGAAAARPGRRRSARCRATRHLLVTPGPDQKRGRLRATRRLRPDPRLLRPDDPLPARPRRRPPAQPGAAHDPRYQTAVTPRNDRLRRATRARRQEQPRSEPLPQALPRPQPLPTTRTWSAAGDLTDIEASVAQGNAAARRRPDL